VVAVSLVAAWALHQWLAPRGHAPLVLVICTLINGIGVIGFMSLRKFVAPGKGSIPAAQPGR
jgi:hypothetical protein